MFINKQLIIKNMNLEEEFNQAIEEWKIHCKKPELEYSSTRVPAVTNCDAYKKIVAMGPKIFPLIRNLYDRDSSKDSELGKIKLFGLISIVKEIAGSDFQMPVEGIKNEGLEQYAKVWLDENMQRYLKQD